MGRFMVKAGLCLLAAACQLDLTSARNIFHFGDSYSSTGFNPKGPLPSRDNPIGNPEFPGSTIWEGTSFLSQMVKANPTSGGSPTLLFNYAYPGAYVNNSLEHISDSSKQDLSDQFESFSAQKAALDGSQDVVSIYFGTNDINNDIDGFDGDPKLFQPLVASLVNVMGEMYEVGARRFLVFGMDPLYRTPSYANGDLPLKKTIAATVGVARYNLQLRDQLDAFQAAHSDAVVAKFDPLPAFYRVLNDPQDYGAPDNTCWNKDNNHTQSCLWFDNLHPGQAIHGEIAKDYAGALKDLKFF